jgi:hypothetical protein
MCGLGVWMCWSFASSWWFFLSGVSLASQENFYFKEHTLSASSLYLPSWKKNHELSFFISFGQCKFEVYFVYYEYCYFCLFLGLLAW